MRVLVLGGGGREHALCAALARDTAVSWLGCSPGNPGIAAIADNLPAGDAVATATAARADLVVVGPEAPLVAGVADDLRAAGFAVFGPSKAAAQLEGSKAFAKDVMAAAGVPTAGHWVASTPAAVKQVLDRLDPPWVVKHDELAAGKGVLVTVDRVAAEHHAVGHTVVIEEFLDGPEISLFCLVDGDTIVPLLPAQDFKRIDDGDEGPNTGGMGAYSPLPWAPANLVDDVVDTVARPTIVELARRRTPFSGLLYCGLALTSAGLKVVEFNARFGDPETQAILELLETPLAILLHSASIGTLVDQPPLQWRAGSAVTVVSSAAGYPGTPRTGDEIHGTNAAALTARVLHAGTALDNAGRLVTSGGRVLSVTAVGPDLAAARSTAYAALECISIEGAHHRNDIAAVAAQDQAAAVAAQGQAAAVAAQDQAMLQGAAK